MRFIQKFIPAIVSATLLIGATGGSVAAVTTLSSRSATVQCADGACTVQVSLDGISPLARIGAALGASALQNKSGTLPGLSTLSDLNILHHNPLQAALHRYQPAGFHPRRSSDM